jgi:predicted acetyltransferase
VIEVSPIAVEDKPVLGHLLELYQYDFSEFDGRDLGENGLFGYPYLDHYWVEPGRHPFFVRADGRLAGFALVRILPVECGTEAHMAEFFVFRKYRRRGVGEEVARQVFARFPGRWVVEQAGGNIPAQRFWQAVIGRYTNGVITERHDEVRGRVIQEFSVG